MNKDELHNFYKDNLQQELNRIEELDQALFRSSLLRIAIFLSVIAILYFFWEWGSWLVFPVIGGIVLFFFFVKRHLALQYRKDLSVERKLIQEKEIRCLDKDFKEENPGTEYAISHHPYCQDVDLFGRGSFYQYMNRTSLRKASDELSKILLSNDISDITAKQNVVQELAGNTAWRHGFSAEASLVKVEQNVESIEDWMSRYSPFVPRWMRHMIVVFSIVSIVLIAMYGLTLIPEGIVVLWLFLGIGISAIFIKKINALQSDTSRSLSTFQQYSKLLERIESQNWKSEMIVNQIEMAQAGELLASESIAGFSKLLNALDQRTNIMISIFTNGFFLRDIWVVLKIESWIEKHRSHVRNWFDLVHFFDTYNSLGNFAFNHPSYTFPDIGAQGPKELIDATDLGHPLLAEVKRIDNDFRMDNSTFYIVTGANMAGKSTFLRTVSLSVIMSNIGLPVCAKSYHYSPIKLVTSMRTSDSLSDEASYFYAELSRLRYIIDLLEDDTYFIILDEILKGTNSVDKASGSKKFVKRLLKTQATGIIATHDLSLCEVANDYEEVSNFYFDAEIIDDELYFDYKIKDGICQNMNASFLLRKMDII